MELKQKLKTKGTKLMQGRGEGAELRWRPGDEPIAAPPDFSSGALIRIFRGGTPPATQVCLILTKFLSRRALPNCLRRTSRIALRHLCRLDSGFYTFLQRISLWDSRGRRRSFMILAPCVPPCVYGYVAAASRRSRLAATLI